MKLRRILIPVLAVITLAAMLGGCTGGGKNPGLNDGAKDKTVGYQLDKPASGEEIAVMHTSMGDISIRFFPEVAPKTVKNFKTHAKDGYYNGLTFHRVIKDAIVQGGDPKGDGTGGESIWNNKFADEFSDKLLNLRGSLSMANSGVNTNGSQFFFNVTPAEKFGSVQAKKNMQESAKKQYNTYKDELKTNFSNFNDYAVGAYGIPPLTVPDEVWNLYAEHGGNISYDGAWRSSGGHTVFGQVFEGMDTVDKISATEANSKGKPFEEIKISSIEIKKYTP